ncbi:MAG: DUF2075 domain-containing protein [Gammaproteobacteria bacterium]|nr:DUF2075 domain-containing protein [Gammaproteobacteria bacterium]
MLVALIGDGGRFTWVKRSACRCGAEAVAKARDRERWQVHAAPALLEHFGRSGVRVKGDQALSLDTEIRFHLTPRIHQWVGGLLGESSPESLAALGQELFEGGHRFLVTRDLNAAKEYLRERYSGAPEARYGVLASSKDRWLLDHGVDNSFQTTKRLRVGHWYNAKPGSPNSCCGLDTVATEFSSQGLELDCALLAWGSDLVRSRGEWSIAYSRGSRSPMRDPLSIRKNVYRVLMTRGRDGTMVFVPPEDRLYETYRFLLKSGARQL